MRVLLPYYHPSRSVVHAMHPDLKIAFVAVVLLASWFGIYRLPLAWSYGVLIAMLVVGSGALVMATSLAGASRVLLLPVVMAMFWVGLFLIVGAVHAWSHVAGWASDPLDQPLVRHGLDGIIRDVRRVVAFLAAAAAAGAFIVSTSVSDLRRAWLVPNGAVSHLELFMSMFTRFQSRVRRILQANALVGQRMTWRGIVRFDRTNALIVLADGLVVFVIATLRDVPALYNFRVARARVLRDRPRHGD